MILSCSVIFLGGANTEPFLPAKGFFLAAANTFLGFCAPIDIETLTGAGGAASAGGVGEPVVCVGESFVSGDSAVVGGEGGFASVFGFEPNPKSSFIFSPS